MSLRVLYPNAEVLNKSAALHMDINAAKGLQDVLKANLGTKGTSKCLLVEPETSSSLKMETLSSKKCKFKTRQ